MNLTYKELAEQISKLTPEQQAMNVTISCDISQEALPAKELHVINDDDFLADVLDPKHPVITIDF